MPFDFTSQPPRPRKSDQLFRSDFAGEPGNAFLRPTPDAYTRGYRRAAEHLVNFALANQQELSILAYPIVFLYRHHVELALKRIIHSVPRVLGRELTNHERGHLGNHKLDQLWQDLEPIIGEICDAVGWEKPERADLEGTSEYIRQLSVVDPSSENFRYWRSRDGVPSLPRLDTFSIRHFSEMMERLADFIDALDTATAAAGQMLDDLSSGY